MTLGAQLPFSWPTRVYWEDTDAGGVVYHASYLRFLERARTEWLRALGLEQAQVQRELDRVFAIRHMHIDFLAPARLDDLIDVRVDAVEVGRASLDFAQTLVRVDAGVETRLMTARVRAASLVGSTFRPIAILPELRERLLTVCAA